MSDMRKFHGESDPSIRTGYVRGYGHQVSLTGGDMSWERSHTFCIEALQYSEPKVSI